MKKKKLGKQYILILGTLFFSSILLEMGVRDLSLRSTILFVRTHKKLFLISLFVLLTAYLFLLALFDHLWISSLFLLFFSISVMIANHQKIKFRGEPVFIYDFENILNIFDLIKMLSVKVQFLAFILMFVIILVAIYLVFLLKNKKRFFFKNKVSRFFSFILSLGILFCFTQVNKIEAMDTVFQKSGYQSFVWNPLRTTMENGVIPSFLYTFPGKLIEEPLGYSEETMLQIKAKYEEKAAKINESRKREDFSDINLIYVLSESLASPNNLSAISVNPDPIPYITSAQDKAYYGELIVPIYGGATPNAEYEVLTSLDIHFLNSNMSLPYQNFLPSFNRFPSVLANMRSTHRKIAAHNHHSNFYQRRRNFSTLGFEEIYFKEDMEGLQKYPDKNYASDASAYAWILDVLQKSNEALFLHFITMQNHTPYPETSKMSKQFSVEGLKESDLLTFSSYLNGIHDSDRQTKKFIRKLEDLDKNVIVLFYGDHHPPLYTEYLNNDLLGKYSTNYFIYSNIEGGTDVTKKRASTSQLNNLVYKLASVKIPPYYAFLLEWHEYFVGFLSSKLYTQDGIMKDIVDLTEEEKEIYEEYKLLQYDVLEGHNYLGSQFWGLD